MPASKARNVSVDPAASPREVYERLLEDPGLRRYLEARALAMAEQPADAQELVAQSYAALLRRRSDPNPPDCIERVMALAKVILEGKIVDYQRRRAGETKEHVDPATFVKDVEGDEPRTRKDQPDGMDRLRPPKVVTPESQLRVVEKLQLVQDNAARVGLTDDLLETMQAVDAGEVTIEQAAEARGMTGSALRVRLHRVRSKLKALWTKHLAIRSTTLVMLLLMLLLALYSAILAGARRPTPPPPIPPSTVETVEVPSGPDRQPRREAPRLPPGGRDKP